jgi:hypothetical protein
VGSQTLGTSATASQVDKLAADLYGRQAKEIRDRRRLNLVQGAAEPEGGVLKHVVSLLPAMDAGKIPEHLPRQASQTVQGGGQQLLPRQLIARPQPIDASLDLRRMVVLGHRLFLPKSQNLQS